MSAEPARHLRVVDQETGEVEDLDSHIQELHVQLDGAEHEIRSWRARYAALADQKTKEAKEHRLFPTAVAVFDYWREQCNHPRSAFSTERFWMLLPFLERHGEAMCKRAIDGAAFDPFITQRKNGTTKRHDRFGLIFGEADKFEDFCNRAPVEPPPPIAGQLSIDEAQQPG